MPGSARLFDLVFIVVGVFTLVQGPTLPWVAAPATVLQAGDRLLIVAPATLRKQTERRLRAVSRAGKLAGWFGEHGL